MKVEEVPGRPRVLRASFFLAARHGLEPAVVAKGARRGQAVLSGG